MFFSAFAAIVMGIVSDRIGRINTMMYSLVTLLSGGLAMCFVNGLIAKIIGFVLFGGTQGILAAQCVYCIYLKIFFLILNFNQMYLLIILFYFQFIYILLIYK